VGIIMLLEFNDLLVRGDTQELLKQCFNRCHAAINVSYEYEKVKAGSFWRLDERYHEQGIEILYERFSYAMAMIADRFDRECSELYHLSEAQKKALTFATALSRAVDEVFRRCIRDLSFEDATMEYYQEDYLDEAYGEFWACHNQLANEVTAVRNRFYREERTFLHGFSENDIESMKDGELETAALGEAGSPRRKSRSGLIVLNRPQEDNRDCLHVMRIYKRWGKKVDAEKFLTATKREYLPMMIRFFIAKPKEDLFADKPSAKWWQFWKG
jgi:hypothetical protein